MSWEVAAAAVTLDLLLGDPGWAPHPVRALGWWVTRAERTARRMFGATRSAGIVLWLSTIGIAVGIVWLSPRWLDLYWVYSLLAIRSLDRESQRVLRRLDEDDLAGARKALSWIVGRDTEQLDAKEIRRAVLETVSENTSDGITAPLFYLALAGAPGMAAYKAINTLDSMVGYRDDRWREIGWFSARVDDAANWIPARLTALFAVVAAALLRLDWRSAWRTAWRDGGSQPSPNAGWPEAAFAGALGVRLGGTSSYEGRESEKPYLNQEGRVADQSAVKRGRALLYGTAFVAVATSLAAIAWRA